MIVFDIRFIIQLKNGYDVVALGTTSFTKDREKRKDDVEVQSISMQSISMANGFRNL